MVDMTMTETIKAYGLKKMIKYLDDNPDENIPKLMDWMEKLDKKFHIVPGQVAAFRNVVDTGTSCSSRYGQTSTLRCATRCLRTS